MDNNRIGENIRYFRKLRGMTQSELGDKCKMADSAIRRYENGRSIPKEENLSKIAQALGVSSFQLRMRGIDRTKEWRDATALDDFLSSIGIDVYYESFDPDNDVQPLVYLQGEDLSTDMSYDSYESFKRRIAAYAKHLLSRSENKEE